jgi:hypothetical protein
VMKNFGDYESIEVIEEKLIDLEILKCVSTLGKCEQDARHI